MENFEENHETSIVEEVVEKTPVVEENPYGQDFANYRTEYMDLKTYLLKHAPESFYKTIKTCAIISYVMIGLNSLNLLMNFWVILDIALLLGFTIGVHIYKNKSCAIGLLAYGIFSCIVGILNAGMPLGWAWVIIPIIYLVQFRKAEKEHKAIYHV